MNDKNYTMSYDERRDYVMDKIVEELEKDHDAFVEACEELDSWNGFLGDIRCIPMCEIDEFFNKPSELLDAMDDFDYNDEYFYFNGYHCVSTTSDVYDTYHDDFDEDEVADALVEDYNHVNLTQNNTLNALLEVAYNENFGIEEDWAYDEDMDEDDMPEETDDEFKDRIDNI